MTELSVVSTFFPLPQDRGDPVRALMILRGLAAVRDYTLFVVRRGDTTPALEHELQRLLPNVTLRIFDPTPFTLNLLGPLGRFPEALAEGMPPWVRSRYSRALHDELRERSGAGLAIGEAAGAYFTGTKLAWHWEKANVLAASTRQDLTEAQSTAYRLRARYLAEVSTRFEAAALGQATSVSVTTGAESQRLREHFGREADFVLPSCVELPEPVWRQPEPGHLVWLSSFSYRSNLLGLQRFLEEGWETLHSKGFRLDLAGSGLSDPVRAALAAHPGVEVTGYVEHLAPWLASAHAAVVPLWSGAGVKLKTLTLLSHSVPVFSTPVGAEGLPESEAVRVAQSPAQLAQAIETCDAAELARMAAQARPLVAEHFSAESFHSRLVTELGRLGLLEARHRQGN